MISSRHRFHGYGSLKATYQFGQTTRGPQFSIKVRPNSRRRSYRLAVVVSRKVNKSAVARNRIRRRIYEVIRQLEADIKEPHDMVISVFSDTVLEQKTAELASQIKRQLKQAKVIK